MEGWPAIYDTWKQSGGVETLTHNDFHLRNVLVSKDGRCPVIFSWENLGRGFEAYKVAHMIAASMPNPDYRPACEKAVLSSYAEVFQHKGVGGYDLDACKRVFRLGVIAVILHEYGPSSIRNSTLDTFRVWDYETVLSEAGV